MNGIIQFIQSELEKIEDIDISATYPDEFPLGTIFAFKILKTPKQRQNEKVIVWRVTLIGNLWSDTLENADIFATKIAEKLNNMNFAPSIEDGGIENNKRKMIIQATAILNDLDSCFYYQS